MKRIFFLLIAASGALSAIAQTPQSNNSVGVNKDFSADNVLPKWVLDVNLLGGALKENYTTAVPGYVNPLNENISQLKFTKGMSYGADAQVGYFFSRNNAWGVGTGLMYLYQTGDANISQFHVEYQSTDSHGLTFRQLLTATDPIQEKLKTTNINIPIVFKYKHRFSKGVGFTADAGALVNIENSSAYSTNASFNYEAIYQYATNAAGQTVAVYDNSPTPSSNDLQVTQAQYLKTHPDGDVNAYMNLEHSQNGYNVGLGVKPNSTTGTVAYTTVTVGLLLQPSINVYLSEKVALNFGLYYIYQPFVNNAGSSTYHLTDQMGSYTSVLKNVSSVNAQSYGLNIGVRMYFGKVKDTDHDGVPDKKDWCPLDSGLVQFHGCPDADGDGIPDYADSCPHEAGLAEFNGCPDSDGDGIPDNEDQCPYQAGPASNHGCPIVPPPAPAPPPPPTPLHFEDVSTPILFETGKAQIHESSFPILEEAAMEMSENTSAFIIIDGHTDNVGSAAMNRALSFKRANAVKTYLMQMGADAKRMIAVGHGPDMPIDTNTTPEGRSHNRRVIMTIKNRRTKE